MSEPSGDPPHTTQNPVVAGPAAGAAGRTAIPLSALALATSITFLVVTFAAPTSLTSSARTVLLAAAALTSPTLMLSATLVLLRPILRGSRGIHRSIVATATLGNGTVAVAATSWSVGFDEADAGRDHSTFADLFFAFSGAAVVIVLFAFATLGYLIGPRPTRPLLRAMVVSAAALPVAVMTLFAAVPSTFQALLATAILVLSVVLPRAGERTPGDEAGAAAAAAEAVPAAPAGAARPNLDGDGVAPAHDPNVHDSNLHDTNPHDANLMEAARRRATTLAVASLSLTVVLWGGAGIASAVLAGQPEATTVLSSAGGASQLAAIPLLWSATTLLVTRRPAFRRIMWAATALSSVIIAIAGVALCVGANPDGVLFFAMLPLLALAASLWTAAAVWPLVNNATTASSGMSRTAAAGTTLALAVGGGFVYVTFVGLTMGIGLLAASPLVAFWGVRAVLGPPAARDSSPAPLPASP